MTEYITPQGKIAYVAPGPAGNYTFYIRPNIGRRKKGTRVRGQTTKLWFNTIEEAENALLGYARDRHWKSSKDAWK
jgi:hypothetical protein